MYAIKEDEVVLQGKVHLTDGLGDIPIRKIIIDKEHFQKPQRQGITYAISKNNYIKQYMCTEKSQKEKKNVFRILYGLNKIIDVNECEILYNKKLKQDTRQYLKVNIQ